MVNKLLTPVGPSSRFKNHSQSRRYHSTMRRDELRQPLRRRGIAERFWAKRPTALQAASAVSCLAMLAGAVTLARAPNPHGGEPVVTALIPPPEMLQTASLDKVQEEAVPEQEMPDAATSGSEKIEDIGEQPAIIEPPEQQTVDTGASIIVSSRKSLAPAPIESVSEEGPYGPLPKIGRNNKRPSSVYARMVSVGITSSDAPKIAIVLGGMGLNDELTRRAIKALPGDVTFAFAPYGENLQPLVNKARAAGHEIVLQIPMEPMGYPQVNPGPKTLASDAGKEANLDALMWHMGRFAGYAGVMNYMGGKFMGDSQAVRPILSELKKRGLLFIGDGTALHGGMGVDADAAGLPLRESRIVIDAEPTPAGIGRALSELEAQARRDGFAIGTGAGLAVTIDAVAEWAKQLGDRGIILVPVTATFKSRV
jgi:uncharacterized protein